MDQGLSQGLGFSKRMYKKQTRETARERKQLVNTLRRLSNLETTIMVRSREGSMDLTISSQSDEHHSTLLCCKKSSNLCFGAANVRTMASISSGVFSGSPFLPLRTNPGVSMMVRLGQNAYSARITIGFADTAVPSIFRQSSVLTRIASATAEAGMITGP